MKKKLLGGVVSAAFATFLMSGTASAGHGHFVVIDHPSGTTTCQYIGGGQTSIDDPDHGGHHRIHDNVHTGTPGTDGRGTTFDKASNQADHDCDVVRNP